MEFQLGGAPFHLTWPAMFVIAVMIGGMIQGIGIGLLFLFKSTGNKAANMSFGALLIVYALALASNIAFHTGFYEAYPQYYFLPIWYTLAFGPFLFYYVKLSLYPSYRMRWSDSKHFLLPFWQMVFFAIIGAKSIADKQMFAEQWYFTLYRPLESAVFIGSFFSYLYFAYRYIRARQHNLRFRWQLRKLVWLKQVVKMLGLLLGAYVVYAGSVYLMYYLFDINLYNRNLYFYGADLAFSAMLYWLAFSGYRHEFRLTDNLPVPLPRRWQKLAAKHQTLPVPARIRMLLEQDKLFLDADLDAAAMAQVLGISEEQLQQHCLEWYQKDFSQLLQLHRVREVQRQVAQLPKVDEEAITQIALHAGFNSRSQFQKVYKEYMERKE